MNDLPKGYSEISVKDLTKEQLLLSVAEEAAEVVQQATKCLRFDPEYIWNNKRNIDYLYEEYDQLCDIADELFYRFSQARDVPIPDRWKRKVRIKDADTN